MKKKPKMARCHSDLLNRAKGLCESCYHKQYENSKNASCHSDKTHFAYGLCRTCYQIKRRSNVKALCHPDRPVAARGLCRVCYGDLQRGGPPKHRKAPDFKSAPIKSFIVYLYVTSLAEPIYVGRGTYGRAISHKYPRTKSLWYSDDLILLTMTCKDEWEAMEYEGKWGGYYRPSQNIQGNREFSGQRKEV